MNLTKKLTLNQLILFQNKKLSEIVKKEIIKEEIGEEFDHKEGDDFSFGINTNAHASVNLYNEAANDDGDKLVELLAYDNLLDQHAVLHYTLVADLQVKAGFEQSFFSLGLSAGQKVMFNNFELHKRNTGLKDAVLSDLKQFKIFPDKNHVLQLEDNEAMTMSKAGQIELEAEVSWSDTLLASISGVTKLLKLKETLKLNVESGVKLSFNLKIKDGFQAIIKKTKSRYWIKLTKSGEKSTLTGIDAGVEVALKNPELTENFINQLLDNVEEELSGKLDKVLSKAVDKLKESDFDILLKVAELFEVDFSAPAEQIMERVAEEKKKLYEKAKKIVESKVKLGASLSYSRIKKTESLFEASLTEKAVKEHHPKVIALKIDELLSESSKNQSGIEVIQYKKLTELDIKKTNKVGLSIGSLELSQEVINQHDYSTQEVYEDGAHMFKISDYSVSKSTFVKLPAANQANALNFNAKMKHYLPKIQMPKCSDFDYELTLTWKQVQKNKTKHYELRSILDLALCWGLIQPLDYEEKYRELEEIIVNTRMKDVEYKAFLKVPYGVYDLLIDDISVLDKLEVAEIFAGAVPYADISGRRTLRERVNNYRQFWLLFQDQNQATLDLGKVKDLLYSHFSQTNLSELGMFEADADGWSNYDKYSIVNLIETNFIADQFNAFKSAMNRLDKRFDTNYNKILLDKTFRKNLTRVRLQREFNMRVLGRLMLVMAEKNNALDRLEMALEIKLSKKVNGSDKIIYTT